MNAMRPTRPRLGVPRRAFLAPLVLVCAIGISPDERSPTSAAVFPSHVADRSSPAAEAAPAIQTPPRFDYSIGAVTPDVRTRMGTSWRPGCPVGLEDLRAITMNHWGFDGTVHAGELMVHERYAKGVAGVFRVLFAARFPIERMDLANGYMGNDPPLAQRNNTVGFNCRAPVGGGNRWSEHSYGSAVDINPDLNPYISRSGRVEPLHGDAFVDRTVTAPGMVKPGDLVVNAFRSIGWRWGGNWHAAKDYMHFSASGR